MRASSALWSATPLSGAAVAAVPPPVAEGRSGGAVTGELRVDDLLVLLGLGRETAAVDVAPGGCAGPRGRRREPAGELLQIGDQRAHAIQPGLLGDRRARIGDRLLGACLVVHGQTVGELAPLALAA